MAVEGSSVIELPYVPTDMRAVKTIMWAGPADEGE